MEGEGKTWFSFTVGRDCVGATWVKEMLERSLISEKGTTVVWAKQRKFLASCKFLLGEVQTLSWI